MPEIPEATSLELYRKMTEIRLFEKRAYDLFMQNLVKGTTHLGTGQEAVAAGVSQAMRDDDYMFVTYRGHNHVLARGTPMTAVMAELLGRENGLMHGKGGSMHLLDTSRGILGAYAIIGAQLVIANGSAWSALYRGTGQVTVCFLGDGATNIGAFHEALNLASVWQLPVVFICENNQYMEYTPIGSVTAVPGLPRTGRPPTGSTRWWWTATTWRRSTRWRRPRSAGPGTAAARRSSRRSPTGTAATPVRTRVSTVPTPRCGSGWPGTRCPPTGRSWPAGACPPGCWSGRGHMSRWPPRAGLRWPRASPGLTAMPARG